MQRERRIRRTGAEMPGPGQPTIGPVQPRQRAVHTSDPNAPLRAADTLRQGLGNFFGKAGNALETVREVQHQRDLEDRKRLENEHMNLALIDSLSGQDPRLPDSDAYMQTYGKTVGTVQGQQAGHELVRQLQTDWDGSQPLEDLVGDYLGREFGQGTGDHNHDASFLTAFHDVALPAMEELQAKNLSAVQQDALDSMTNAVSTAVMSGPVGDGDYHRWVEWAQDLLPPGTSRGEAANRVFHAWKAAAVRGGPDRLAELMRFMDEEPLNESGRTFRELFPVEYTRLTSELFELKERHIDMESGTALEDVRGLLMDAQGMEGMIQVGQELARYRERFGDSQHTRQLEARFAQKLDQVAEQARVDQVFRTLTAGRPAQLSHERFDEHQLDWIRNNGPDPFDPSLDESERHLQAVELGRVLAQHRSTYGRISPQVGEWLQGAMTTRNNPVNKRLAYHTIRALDDQHPGAASELLSDQPQAAGTYQLLKGWDGTGALDDAIALIEAQPDIAQRIRQFDFREFLELDRQTSDREVRQELFRKQGIIGFRRTLAEELARVTSDGDVTGDVSIDLGGELASRLKDSMAALHVMQEVLGHNDPSYKLLRENLLEMHAQGVELRPRGLNAEDGTQWVLTERRSVSVTDDPEVIPLSNRTMRNPLTGEQANPVQILQEDIGHLNRTLGDGVSLNLVLDGIGASQGRMQVSTDSGAPMTLPVGQEINVGVTGLTEAMQHNLLTGFDTPQGESASEGITSFTIPEDITEVEELEAKLKADGILPDSVDLVAWPDDEAPQYYTLVMAPRWRDGPGLSDAEIEATAQRNRLVHDRLDQAEDEMRASDRLPASNRLSDRSVDPVERMMRMGREMSLHGRWDHSHTEYNQQLFRFIGGHEGLKQRSYQDGPARSIGYGVNLDQHKQTVQQVLGLNDTQFQELYRGDRTITKRQARELYLTILGTYEDVVSEAVGEDLPDHRRVALVSLAYNLPAMLSDPELRRGVREGDDRAVVNAIMDPDKIHRWYQPRYYQSIARRRYEEALQYLGSERDRLSISLEDYLEVVRNHQ